MKKFLFITLVLLISFDTAFAQMQYLWIKGYKYYPLDSVCQQKEIDYDWDSVGRIATLKKNGVTAKIMVGSDRLLINDKDFKDIGPPLSFADGEVVIPASFVNTQIDRIFKYEKEKKAKPTVQRGKEEKAAPIHTIKTIVLDPGHGGKDPGAIGRYYRLREKHIVLDIAMRLKDILSAYGIDVYMTRDRDVFIPLWKRADFANKKNADFFISIHANSSRSKQAKGFEVYYLSEATDDSAKALEAAENAALKFEEGSLDRYNINTRAIASDLTLTENRIESRELAKYLVASVKENVLTRDKSTKSARFLVLKNTNMPAILIETGFISNKKEEEQLGLSSYRVKLAETLADGILAYKDTYEKTNGFSR